MTPIGNDPEEPVASEQPARDAAGFANSGAVEHDDRPADVVQPLRRGSTFPWLRALLVAVIAGVSMASPLLGSITAAFAVALLALGIVRGAGRAFMAICVLAAAVVGGAVASGADLAQEWMALTVIASAVVALLGIAQWRAALPDPVADTDGAVQPESTALGQLRAPGTADPSSAPLWPEPRIDRGLSFAIATWLLAAIVLVGLTGVMVGTGELSRGLRSTVRTSFADSERACAPKGVFAQDEATCERLDSMRDYLMDAARDHAPTMLTLFAALALVSAACLAHLIVVARSRALAEQGWHVPTRPRYRLRDLEFHWGYAYVGVIGVLAIIAARALDGAVQEWTFAVGAGLAAVAGQVIAMHGAGFAGWVLSRRPLPIWYRIVLVAAVLFAWPFVLGVLLIVGALDLQFAIRRRFVALTPPGAAT